MNQSGNTRRINVQCSCGKRLLALPQHAGKRVKCPACGKALVVPASASPPPMAATPQVENESQGMSKNTLIALWSFVGVFALACVLFLVWHSHSSHQAKITAANERISKAVASANEWLGGNSSLDGEALEQRLVDALQNNDATERTDGESSLSRVRQRREQLAEEARIEQAERQATAVFEDAKKRLDGNDVGKAIELLREYVAHPHATAKTDAQRLLTEAETAVSDSLTLDALIAMTDGDFGRVRAAGEIQDGKVTHPVLIAARTATVQRNLNKAAQRREEIKITEQKRREAEKLAAMERQRQEEARRQQEEAERRLREAREPLRVFLGGELSGDQAAYYRLLPVPNLKEIRKNDSGSVFDKADQPDWDSKFAVENIVLAPGAVMSVSVENYAGGAFGQHSEWSWNIAVAVPDGASAYKGISFAHAVGGEVDSWLFQLAGTAELDGMTLALYKFQERWKPIPTYDDLHRPIDKILRRMTSAGAIKYRISTGSKGLGPVHEGEFSRETTQGLIGLLRTAKYKNWMDKPQYDEEWMRP